MELSVYERLRRQMSKDFSPVPSTDPDEHRRIEEERIQAEAEKREQVRTMFNNIDSDKDGNISVTEMKEFIKIHKPEANFPGLAKKILKMADGDGDRKLCFDEFYKLTNNPKLNWLFRYAHLMEPPRNKIRADDMESGYGDYENMMKCWPFPVLIIVLSLLETGVFILDISNLTSNNTTGIMTNYLQYDSTKRYEVWRFVTYMFVHSNKWHLLLNILFQLFLGIPIEMAHKWRVVIVYMAGVLLGSIGASVFNHSMCLVGASGGVYALLTAHIAIVILNWHQMRLGLVNLFICVVYCLVDLIYAIFESNESVSYLTHFFGGVAGLLVGIGVLRNLEERLWEKKLWWMSVGLYGLLMTGGVIYHIFIFK